MFDPIKNHETRQRSCLPAFVIPFQGEVFHDFPTVSIDWLKNTFVTSPGNTKFSSVKFQCGRFSERKQGLVKNSRGISTKLVKVARRITSYRLVCSRGQACAYRTYYTCTVETNYAHAMQREALVPE